MFLSSVEAQSDSSIISYRVMEDTFVWVQGVDMLWERPSGALVDKVDEFDKDIGST
jgi:hypothetical protein